MDDVPKQAQESTPMEPFNRRSLFNRRRISAKVYAIITTVLLVISQFEDPVIEKALIRDLKLLDCGPTVADVSPPMVSRQQ